MGQQAGVISIWQTGLWAGDYGVNFSRSLFLVAIGDRLVSSKGAGSL